MNKNDYLFKSEKPSKALLKFCVPAIIGMVINSLFNFVDAIFIGQLGTEQMAASAITFPIAMFFIGVGMIFGTGGGSYISRLLGKKDQDRSEKTSSVSVFGGVLFTIILTAVFLLSITPILKMLGASGKTLEYAKEYAIPYLIGSVFVVVNITLTNLVRSQGAILFSMLSMAFAGILNIVLDPLLMFTFGMGISGAAVATIISRMCSILLFVWYYKTGRSTVNVGLKQVKPDRKMLSEIFKIGIPGFLFQLLTTISTAIINILASGYGTEAVAAMGIVMRIMGIGMFVVFGYSKGFQPIAGYNYGAGNISRLKRLTNLSMIYTTILSLIMTGVYFVFSENIINLFTTNTAVLEMSKDGLFAASYVLPTFGIQFIITTLFLSCGKGKQGSFLSMARQGIFFIPLAFLLSSTLGLTGIYWIQPISDLLSFAAAIVLGISFFRSLSKKDSREVSFAE